MATSTYSPVDASYNLDNPFEVAWVNYILALKSLMGPIPEDRAMDQYLRFRDEVMQYVLSRKFLDEVNYYWQSNYSENYHAFDLLLMELNAFPLGVEVAQMEAAAEATAEAPTATDKKKGWRNWRIWKWLNRGGTVAGSVKDIFKDLPWYAKHGITILKEVIDLFKGKG